MHAMTAQSPTIFSYTAQTSYWQRARPVFDTQNPILRDVQQRLAERMGEMTHQFLQLALLDDVAGHMQALLTTFPNINAIHLLPHSKIGHIASDDLQLPEARFHAIISSHLLGAINDLAGVFIQLQRALTPDGLLLACLPGAETLKELRHALAQAEAEITGGISPRIHPFMDVRDAGNLLARAGFNLPLVDRDIITIHYPDIFALMHELRQMGQSNILLQRNKNFAARQLFFRAAEIYQQQFGHADGSIPATLELLTLTAWKPAASQPKPLAPGSGKISLKQFLK